MVYHHLDPNEKENNATNLFYYPWKIVKAELDKCIPMCDKSHKSMEEEIKRFVKKAIKGGYVRWPRYGRCKPNIKK